jgi:hypothetical protein
MKVKSITFGRTFSDGKGTYEFTRIDLTADVEPSEDENDAFKDLVDKVNELRELQLDMPDKSNTIEHEPPNRSRRPRR